jgi:hypothetical protein
MTRMGTRRGARFAALAAVALAASCSDDADGPTGGPGADSVSASSGPTAATGGVGGQHAIGGGGGGGGDAGGGGSGPAGPLLAAKLPGNETEALEYRDVFETWLGRPLDAIAQFTATQHWTDSTGEFIAASYFMGHLEAADRPVIWAVGLVPEDAEDGALAEVVAGDHDVEFVEAATRFAEFRPQDPNVYIRLAWEMNGDWYKWSTTGTPDDYVEAWRRVIEIFRDASPRFRFVWCPSALAGTEASTEAYYPGDDYVDVIGLDVYWFAQYQSPDPAQAFTMVRDNPVGLAWQAAFAASRGKPISIEEWGVADDGGPFVDGMAEWFEQHPPLWHAYWDSNASYLGRISDDMSGTTGERYKVHFGAP